MEELEDPPELLEELDELPELLEEEEPEYPPELLDMERDEEEEPDDLETLPFASTRAVWVNINMMDRITASIFLFTKLTSY